MPEAKIIKHMTLLIEKAGAEKGNYAIVTHEPSLRNELWSIARKCLNGLLVSATHSSCEIKLKNGSAIKVLVNKTKDTPRWLSFDAVYYDGSF
tara:strand:+ start:36281 stop:36559 length:279 start_codon:yes stop_codon:yes gene_type:complete